MTWTAASAPFSAIGVASTWSLGEDVRQMDLEFDTLTSTHPTNVNKQTSKHLDNQSTQPPITSRNNDDIATQIGRSAIMEMDQEFAQLHETRRTQQPSKPASNQKGNNPWLQDMESHEIDRQLREILDSDSAIDEFYADVDATAEQRIRHTNEVKPTAIPSSVSAVDHNGQLADKVNLQSRQATTSNYKRPHSSHTIHDPLRNIINVVPAKLPTIEEGLSMDPIIMEDKREATTTTHPLLTVYQKPNVMNETIDESALPYYPHISQLPKQSTTLKIVSALHTLKQRLQQMEKQYAAALARNAELEQIVAKEKKKLTQSLETCQTQLAIAQSNTHKQAQRAQRYKQCALHLRNDLLEIRRKAADVQHRSMAQRREMDRINEQLDKATEQIGKYRVQVRQLEKTVASQKEELQSHTKQNTNQLTVEQKQHQTNTISKSTSLTDSPINENPTTEALVEAREQCRRLQRQLEYAGYRIREVEEERDTAIKLAKKDMNQSTSIINNHNNDRIYQQLTSISKHTQNTFSNHQQLQDTISNIY
ncbi:hypothetical protein BDF22DRAFT_740677 [Syncephalis plumigaleata]|nr:hypothetical protein BDF22DRAFT_740677 [Syncephalis plumigaleata]